MSTAFATLQSRESLEDAQAQKKLDSLRTQRLAEIFATAKFGGMLFRPTQAAAVEIIRACATYHGVREEDVVPSVETLQEIYLRQRQYFNQTFGPTNGEMFIKPEDARRDAIFEICIALKCGRPSITEVELAAERSRLQYFSLQALRNRLNVILQSQRLCGKSAEQIRTELAQARAEAAPLPPRLPVELTPTLLKKKLREMARYETDRFAQKFGWDVINARLQGRDEFQQ
jgi:hypothetical protein